MIWCLLIEKVRTESVYLKMDLKPTRRWFKIYLYSDKSNIIAVGYVYNFLIHENKIHSQRTHF